MTDVMNQPPQRQALSELQTMMITVISNIDPKDPRRKVAGWTEGPIETTEDLVINEPIYFIDHGTSAVSDATATVRIAWEFPHNGLPEHLIYSAVDEIFIYEGVTDFGALYISAVATARRVRTRYEAKWTHLTAPGQAPNK